MCASIEGKYGDALSNSMRKVRSFSANNPSELTASVFSNTALAFFRFMKAK